MGWPLSVWGNYAVASFIYLSSFCAIRYGPPAVGRTGSYWWSRFKAVYPTFAIISILLFAASFICAPRKTGVHYTPSDIAANLLMISDFAGKPWMTEPMWFVPFVLQVYLILPFLTRKPVRLPGLPVAFLVSGGACAAVFALHPAHVGDPEHICRTWSPIFRLPEVVFGCVLARAQNLAKAVPAIVVYAVCCLLYALLAIRYPEASQTLLLPLNGVMVFLVLAAVVSAILPLLKGRDYRFISLLGRASFPFFLLHGPWIPFVSTRFGKNIPAWVLCFVLCWAAAVLLMLALENIMRRKVPDGR
jgi:peptidoglycan/LPS O-acetylase OafA/YrhL